MLEMAEITRDADREHRDADVAIFAAAVSGQARRAAWALAVTLAATEEQLAELMGRVWPQSDSAHCEAGVKEMLSWPFAVRDLLGWRIDDAGATALALDFRASDAEAYRRAHELLLAEEEEREADADPDEAWFVRGRIAYYLVGLDAAEAADRFGRVFGTEPNVDRLSARMWLTSLALRKEHFMGDQPRSLRFFRGFRSYVLGDRDAAREVFEDLWTTGEHDIWRAIAGHLLGVIVKQSHPGRAGPLLEESIRLSEDLNLIDNEIMARNSLAYLCARNARHRVRDAEPWVRRAHELAQENLQRAETTGDERLQASCERAAAGMEWLFLTRDRSVTDDVTQETVTRITERLRRASDAALDHRDLESAGLAINDAAQVHIDVAEHGAALDEIDRFLRAAEPNRLPAAALRKLARTVGEIEVSDNEVLARRASELTEQLEQLRVAGGGSPSISSETSEFAALT